MRRRGLRPATQDPRAALAGWAGSPTGAEAALRAAGIDPRTRGEQLGIEEFAALPPLPRRRASPRVRAVTSAADRVGLGDRPRPGQDQPPAVVGAARADGYHDLSHRLPRRRPLRRRHRRPARRRGGVTVHGPASTPTGCPLDDTQPRGARRRALADAAGVDGRSTFDDPQGHPGRRRHGRRLRRRRGRAGGLRRAVGTRPAPRPTLLELAARARQRTCRSPCIGGTALGSGRGDQLTPVLARGRYHLGVRPRRRRPVDPGVYAECDRLRGRRPVPDPQPSAP